MSHYKEELKNKAIDLTERNEKHLAEETKKSVNESIIYREITIANATIDKENKPNIVVSDLTTEKAISEYGHCCALNFASFKWPGGGFILGSMAQEEALCHASNLYNILSDKKFAPHYAYNRENTRDGLYTNFGIFTPNVVFNDTRANIITVAAPNLSVYGNYKHFDKDVYETTMKDRIRFILDIAEANQEKTLILGAFGCGVFKNDPIFVASIFKELLENGEYSFETVVFAIPKGKNNNLEAFIQVFGEK